MDELSNFLANEEELVGLLDEIYGETPRQRQENMRLVSRALSAMDSSQDKPIKSSEAMSPRTQDEYSAQLMKAASVALCEVS